MDELEKTDELKSIATPDAVLELGGKIRRIHIGMKAWKIIKEKYGRIDELMQGVSSNPIDFITDKLPDLLQLAIVKDEGEEITRETVEDWLDRYGLNDLKNKVLPAFVASIMDSLPQAEKKNPTKKAKIEA